MLRLISGQTLLEMLAASKEAPGNAGINVPMLGTTLMPKIIHQSWKTANVPGIYAELQKTWHDTYPDWLHVLWTDQDNDELVKTHYPEWLEVYNALMHGINRADMARNMYMHTFGGMYADLDFDSYKSIEPLFLRELEESKKAAFLGRMADPDPPTRNLPLHCLPNAWLASTPHHPFWLDVLANSKLTWDRNEHVYDGWHAREQPEYITGPVNLHKTYHQYISKNRKDLVIQESNPIVVFPPALLYSFPWYATKDFTKEDVTNTMSRRKGDFDLEKMRKKFNNGVAYARTYWGASWQVDGFDPEIASVEQGHVLRISREYDALR